METKTKSKTKPSPKLEPVRELLRAWSEDDEDEQRETLEYLQRALDEDRLSNRKLFP
jgi:hypothetical protein